MPAPRRKKKKSRKATYDSGRRLARFMAELPRRPRGWEYEDIQRTLGVSRRTVLRYVEACKKEFVDDEGKPLVEVVRSGERSVVRFKNPDEAPGGTGWEVLSLFFSLRLARVLDGTVVAEMADQLMDRVRDAAPREDNAKLRNLERKLFCLPFMPRDYTEKDDVVNAVLRALIEQQRMRVDYEGVIGEGRTHVFDPYSLVEHRGALYLLGKSHLEGRIVFLAVERIASLDNVCDADGTKVRFAYPAAFDPARHTDGMFGVYDGDRMRVVLALQNERTRAYLEARRLHPTQRFYEGPDGRTHLELTVRGKHELANWIISSSPWVEVLEPADLRAEVADRLRSSAAIYGPLRAPVELGPPLQPLRQAPVKKPASRASTQP